MTYFDDIQMQSGEGPYIRKVTWVGLLVNIVLAIIKLAGGILGNSQAIVADAVHSFSDGATDIAVLIGSLYWSRPPDDDHPYGHRRIETVVTLFIGVALFAAALELALQALTSIHSRRSGHTSFVAAVAAFVSIVVKEILYRWTANAGKRAKSPALTANAHHHRSDAISSIPALFAVIIATVLPEWGFIDCVGAVVVAIFIFHAALKIVTPAGREILEAGAPRGVLDDIRKIAHKERGVCKIQNLRSRYVGSNLIIDMQMFVDGGITVLAGHAIAENVHKRIMRERDDILDIIIHIEPEDSQNTIK